MTSINEQPATLMPWYVESEFAVLANVGGADATQAYGAWKRRAVEAIVLARRKGYAVQIMPVRLAAFRDWLACTQRRDSADSRRAFILACASRSGPPCAGVRGTVGSVATGRSPSSGPRRRPSPADARRLH